MCGFSGRDSAFSSDRFERKEKMELRSSLFAGTDADASVMVQCDMLDDCQSDTASALFLAGGWNPVESFEDSFPVFFRNSAAEITDAEVHLISFPAGGKFNASGAAVDDGVGDQIVQGLKKELGIALEFFRVAGGDRQLDTRRFRCGAADFHRAAEKGEGLDRKKIIFGFMSDIFQRGQSQEIQQEGMEAFRLSGQGIDAAFFVLLVIERAVADGIDRADNAGQRSLLRSVRSVAEIR